MNRLRFAVLTALAGCSFLSNLASAQTLPSGVINVPPTSVGSGESIGSNTTLNVLDGGRVRYGFEAGVGDGPTTNVVVNISGGTVFGGFNAYDQTLVNITGGQTNSNLTAHDFSEVNVSGGQVGQLNARDNSVLNLSGGTLVGVTATDSSTVEIMGGSIEKIGSYDTSTTLLRGGVVGQWRARESDNTTVVFSGGEYELNGEPYLGSSITLSQGDVFAGILQDGSPFIFSPFTYDMIVNVTLAEAPLPAIDTTPMVVDGASPSSPTGLRTGQVLALRDGGELGAYFRAIDATLNIEGGVASHSVEALRSEVNVAGGAVGDNFHAYEDSVVTVVAGDVGDRFGAFAGSRVILMGGTVGREFRALQGSATTLLGGDFELNGQPYLESTVTLADGETLTGTFADGSPFLFSYDIQPDNGYTTGDVLDGVTLVRTPLSAADTTPLFVDAENPTAPNGLRPGQSLTLRDGGELPANFTAIGATIRLEGGDVVGQIEVADSQVTVAGGNTGRAFRAYGESAVTIDGGRIDGGAYGSSTVILESGYIDPGFKSYDDSTVIINGGNFGSGFFAYDNSTVILNGGQMDDFYSVQLHDNATLVANGGAVEAPLYITNGSAVINGGEVMFLHTLSGGDLSLHDGTLHNITQIEEGSTVSISGGAWAPSMRLFDSTINISGGVMLDSLMGMIVSDGGEIHLYGSELLLDGVLFEGLEVGVPYAIDTGSLALVDGAVEGTLADSSTFGIDLTTSLDGAYEGLDYFGDGGLLTFTLVSQLSGDYNNDGVVDGADYVVWRDSVGKPQGTLLNDVDGGTIGSAQYDTWAANYGAVHESLNASAVPEPWNAGLLSAGLLISPLTARRETRSAMASPRR